MKNLIMIAISVLSYASNAYAGVIMNLHFNQTTANETRLDTTTLDQVNLNDTSVDQVTLKYATLNKTIPNKKTLNQTTVNEVKFDAMAQVTLNSSTVNQTVINEETLNEKTQKLFKLARLGNVKKITDFLNNSREVDINAKDNSFPFGGGRTALMKAAGKGHVGVVEILLSNSAEVDVLSDNNFTALIYASINGHIKIVNLMLEKFADVNVKTNQDWTALMGASYNGHDKVVKRLLTSLSINVNATCDGKTALDYAKEQMKKGDKPKIYKRIICLFKQHLQLLDASQGKQMTKIECNEPEISVQDYAAGGRLEQNNVSQISNNTTVSTP